MSLRLDRGRFTSHNYYNYQLVVGLKKLSLEILQTGCPLFCKFGNPFANVSEIICNTVANLLQDARWYWQPSDNFLRKFLQL
jgi:hypothetical protein